MGCVNVNSEFYPLDRAASIMARIPARSGSGGVGASESF